MYFFFSSRRRHTRLQGDWSSDVCSSDLEPRLRERSVGLLLPMRSEVLPEERVEDMAGQVEGQGPFQRREAREVPLDTGLMQLLERIIGAFDIPCVVLVVVELHDAP